MCQEKDLSEAVKRLEAALAGLQADKSSSIHRETVCVETRAIFASFEDMSFWLGEVDFTLLTQLRRLFTAADALMATVDDGMYAAVSKRCQALQSRNFTEFPPELSRV